MSIRKYSLLLILVLPLVFAACSGGDSEQAVIPAEGSQISGQISGKIEDGLRVLTINPTDTEQKFTIYRGDYVRAQLTTGASFTLKIAALDVDKTFPVAEGDKPYFKVPEAGSFRFSVGSGKGTIEAIEYSAAAYKEVASAEAVKLIANIQPLILDVRTAREYKSGHLENSTLLPVQEFQKRVGELASYKNKPVFVYCRTGNRSTVAAKILVDKGFTNVVNLRRGIVEWRKAGLPVVK